MMFRLPRRRQRRQHVEPVPSQTVPFVPIAPPRHPPPTAKNRTASTQSIHPSDNKLKWRAIALSSRCCRLRMRRRMICCSRRWGGGFHCGPIDRPIIDLGL